MAVDDPLAAMVSTRIPPPSPATLEHLSATISSKTAELSKILEANSIPPPSFDERSFVGKDAARLVVDKDNLRAVRNELITAAQDLIRLAQGPVDHLLTLAWSVCLDGRLPQRRYG
jgi:6-hydroxytryprostatin B O-methyltransferase